jgi:DNA-directed RNA polymerase specialized sigma24 family protein
MRSTLSEITAPADYEQLHRQYFGYVVQFVIHQGIEPQSAEDVASEIFVRLIATDILGQFDSSLTFIRGGELKTARFKSFLNAKVVHYVRHHRDRQIVRNAREPIICDSPLSEGGDSWVQAFGPSFTEEFGEVYEQELVRRIAAHLEKVPRRSTKDQCDLVHLFEAVVGQVRLTGRINKEELQQLFGISSTAISSWLKLLRVHVRVALEAQA